MRRIEVECGNLTLGGLAAGDPSRPGLVLLHGWPQSSSLYGTVVDALGDHFFVLAFDLPEIGASRGAPASAEKTVLADTVLAAAERAGARSPVVAGIDVGGMIAYAAARDHGHRIRGAVVCNTVIPGIDPWEAVLANPSIWHFAFHALPDLPETLVTGRQRPYFDFFIDALAGRREALTSDIREQFARAYARPEALKAGFDWYRALAADARHNASRRPFTTPLLYLRGDADGRSPDDYVPALRAAGAARVTGEVLKDSGEFAPLEAREAFVQALLRFASAC